MPDTVTPSQTAAERRSATRPSGLPIFSTEKLTGAERAQMLALQEGYHRATLMIDLSLAIGRVDEALATLQALTRDLDGQAAAIAAALGSNR